MWISFSSPTRLDAQETVAADLELFDVKEEEPRWKFTPNIHVFSTVKATRARKPAPIRAQRKVLPKKPVLDLIEAERESIFYKDHRFPVRGEDRLKLLRGPPQDLHEPMEQPAETIETRTLLAAMGRS